MKENLKEPIKSYDIGGPGRDGPDGQTSDTATSDINPEQVHDGSETSPDHVDEDAAVESKQPMYEVRNGSLFKKNGDKEACLANFHMKIVAQHINLDEGHTLRREFEISLYLNGRTISLVIPAEDFCSHRLMNHIVEHIGSEAIIYGSHKDLRIAAQESSVVPVPFCTLLFIVDRISTNLSIKEIILNSYKDE